MFSSVKQVFVDIDKRLLQSVLTILVLLTMALSVFDQEHFRGISGVETLEQRIVNRLHLATATVSTVGYGDIAPKSMEVKLICIVAQILMMIEFQMTIRNVYEMRFQQSAAAARRR